MAKRRTINEQIRQLVLRSGLTSYRIEKHTGVSTAVLSRFVRGETGLSMRNADKLCVFFDAKIEARKPEGRVVKPKKKRKG